MTKTQKTLVHLGKRYRLTSPPLFRDECTHQGDINRFDALEMAWEVWGTWRGKTFKIVQHVSGEITISGLTPLCWDLCRGRGRGSIPCADCTNPAMTGHR